MGVFCSLYKKGLRERLMKEGHYLNLLSKDTGLVFLRLQAKNEMSEKTHEMTSIP